MKFSLFFLLLLLLLPGMVFSQLDTENPEIYKWFDNRVGYENTELFNGVEYLEQHITINEKQPFFHSVQFILGDLVYQGQPYFEIPLKYNVFEDLLLVKLPKRGGEASFQLHNEKINAFSIGEHHFVKIPATKEEQKVTGFYEILLQNDQFQLLKKYRKKRKKLLDKEYTYFEFEDDSPQYAVFVQDNHYKIDAARDLRNIFKNQQEFIKNYYRNNSSLHKSNSDLFMIGLFEELAAMPESEISAQ